jgi:putative colanic acid biosynthesis acetyltransferase WcaF
MNDDRTDMKTLYQRLDTTQRYPYALSEYVRKFLWKLVQGTLIRLSPSRLRGWREFWLRLFGAKIARTSTIRPSTKVHHPWLLTMGEHSCLSEGVHIYNLGSVSIGDHTVISQDAYICAGTHDYTRSDLPLLRPTITIGNGVWICAGAFVCPGVTIGDNVIVGARAVVTRDVPPGVMVGGNPARVLRERPRPANVPPEDRAPHPD